MNNVDTGRIRPCTGCLACYGVCPLNAIKCTQDENGFYRPYIDTTKCVECGLCRTVCYSHKEQISAASCLKAYYGWHKDEYILRQSASGGITVALCQSLMNEGYFVIGCSYDNTTRKAKHIILKQPQEIPHIIGSKYFQSDLSEIIDQLKNMPKTPKIAFFGVPCQILGIKELLPRMGVAMNAVLLVELFCHGIVSPLVWQSYLNERLKTKNIENVRFRTKYYGWHIPANEFVVGKRSLPTVRTGDLFFEAFYSTEYFNLSCYNCEARQNIGNADIRIGDYWGERFKDNKKGVSCIITSSAKGDAALNACRDYFELFNGDLEEILSAQSFDKAHPYNEANWCKNYAVLKESGLRKSIKQVKRRMPIKVRAQRTVFQSLSNFKHKILK